MSAKVCSKVIVGAHWTRARACRATPAAIGTSTMRRGTGSTTALTATFAFFPQALQDVADPMRLSGSINH